MGTEVKARFVIYVDRQDYIYGFAAAQGHFGPILIKDHTHSGQCQVTHKDTNTICHITEKDDYDAVINKRQ